MFRQRKSFYWIFCLVILGALIVTACSPAPEAAKEEPAPAVTEQLAKEATEEKVPATEAAAVTEEAPATEAAQPAEVEAGTADTGQYKKEGPYTFCFSNASVSNSWRVSMVEHLRYAIEQHPEIENLIETDANDDPAKQISDTEDLLTKDCDILIISPATQEALTPVAAKAMAAGIPVVTLDRNVSGEENYVSYVNSSNCEMGKAQAEWLVETLGGKGNIVLLSGIAGASPAEERLQCAREVFTQNPDIKELAQEYANWSPVEGKQIMENWLVQFEQIDGVWADSGLQASGAVEAFVEAGLDVPPVTGEDFNRYLKQMKEIGFEGVVVTFPVNQGGVAVQIALDILAGKPVQKNVDVPREVITKENLDKYVRMDLPDDYWASALPEVAQRMFPE
ncbi:MAG: substrate-binding domain-containing protein [Anaerolineales bacterium]|nr:substrate-binding domain-containing protein [Anaerolineales bacterium]